MFEDNVAIALQIMQEHQPEIVIDHGYCECCGSDHRLQCSAKGCAFDGSIDNYEGVWGKHVLDAINNALGMWGPEDEEQVDF